MPWSSLWGGQPPWPVMPSIPPGESLGGSKAPSSPSALPHSADSRCSRRWPLRRKARCRSSSVAPQLWPRSSRATVSSSASSFSKRTSSPASPSSAQTHSARQPDQTAASALQGPASRGPSKSSPTCRTAGPRRQMDFLESPGGGRGLVGCCCEFGNCCEAGQTWSGGRGVEVMWLGSTGGLPRATRPPEVL